LNSAIGYITPKDMLAGRQEEIHSARDRKLDEARKRRPYSPAAGSVNNGPTWQFFGLGGL
jgi:hypothetical protein